MDRIIRNIASKLFRWRPTSEVLIALGSGGVVIILSASMLPFSASSWAGIVIRDIAMIFLAGIAFPLFYMLRTKSDFSEFGLTTKRWYLFLPINLLLAVGLFFLFKSDTPHAAITINAITLQKVGYLMLAGIFESLFFYSFMRTLFERAFGIVPAIVLASLFYSFHHVGFQPEYGKLIIVGLLYTITFRAGNSLLMIYPFFWGIGASYDVLIQSKEVSAISYPGIRSLYLAVLILTALVWTWRNAKSVRTSPNSS